MKELDFPSRPLVKEVSATDNKTVNYSPIRVLAANKANSHENLLSSLSTSVPSEHMNINLVGEVVLNLYDTQDWKLSSGGYFVETQVGSDNNVTFTLRCTDQPSSHFNIHDFTLFPNAINLSTVKELGLRRLLQRLADGRALVKLASVSSVISEIEFYQHKTGLRLGRVRLITPKGLPEHWIEIEMIVGVDPTPTLKNITRSLKPYLISNTDWDRWASVMRANNRKRFDYNQLGQSTFDVGDSPITSLKTMGMNLYQRVMLNSDGVVGDYDLEYCHDIRVDLRKTRVILEHLGHLNPTAKGKTKDTCSLRQLEKRLKRFQTICGAQRDLDVFLINLSAVESKSLEMAVHFKNQRGKAHSTLCQFIEGSEFSKLLDAWNNSLRCIGQRKSGGVGTQKMINFAYNRVESTYKDFTEQAKLTDTVASHEEMHNLRKKGKHLRYTLELFEPVFPHKLFKVAIKELKETQDLLGAFQDAEVALHLLESIAPIANLDLSTRDHLSSEREALFDKCLVQVGHFLASDGLKTINRLLKELNKQS